jgi:PAS domain S-box-containing protein
MNQELEVAQASPREGEVFVQSVLDSLTAHVVVLDAQGAIVLVNQAWKEFALQNGAAPETVDPAGADYLASCTAATPQGDARTAQLAIEGIRAVLDGVRAHFSMEYACDSPTEQRWFRMSVSRRTGPQGGVTIAHENLTERKLAEQALRDSEANLRAISENTSVGVLVLLDGRFAFVNPHGARMLGYAAGELEQRPVADLIHPGYRTMMLDRYRLRLAGKDVPNRYESVALAKDGRAIPVEVTVAVTNWNGQAADVVFVSDISERKRAEESLRLGEANLRAVAENASVGITIFQDSRRVFANRRAAEMLGYSVEEFLPLAIADVVHPDSRNLVLERSLKRVAGEDVPARYEFTALAKDGRAIPVEGNYAVIAWNGQPAIIAFVVDIVERKRAEAALQRQEYLLSQSQRIARIGSWSFDLATQSVAWTDETYRLYGVSRDRFVPSAGSLLGLIHPDDRTAMQDWIGAAAAGENPGALAFRVVLPDGSTRILNGQGELIRDGGGRPVQLIGTAQDITERVSGEMERKAVQQRFHDLFEYAPDATVIVDPVGRITLANRQAEMLFGYSREELIGLQVDKLMPQADKRDHERSRQQYFLNPVSRTMGGVEADLRARRKDGTTLPVDISLNPLHSDEGMLVVATVRDITDRLQAEQQRQGLEAQLRQAHKMEAIGTLAGGIAHDFNNIVSAIIGNVELAREDVGAGHPAIESLDEIRKASRRARDLVSQILAFSRQQPQSRHAVALSAVVEEVVTLLRATLPAGIELGTALAADAPSVVADPTQIHQILMNLCTNAWHAMDEARGRIDLRLDSVVLGEDAARTHAELGPGRYARLSVKDNGKGMDAVTRERIFEPFFTTKEVGEGTGLGLSVVHGIMRSYHGAITVDSRPGSGTTFQLYFPAADAAAETAGAQPAPAPLPPGRGQRVLYLDDDESLVLLVTRTLARNGYRVAGYTDSAEALQALRADPGGFDLVVTDYNMPGMSGLDVAHEVSRIRPGLPVAVTSGYITDELKEKTPAAGVRQLIYKPDSAEDLCETVQRLLDQGT